MARERPERQGTVRLAGRALSRFNRSPHLGAPPSFPGLHMATFVKTRDIPIAGAHTLPQEFFTSAELFAQELDRIFARRWLCIGRESKIANRGDYFLHTIGKDSIIVLRDQSGEVRAHYNTCRHRGARICEAASGTLSETHPVSVSRLDVRARRAPRRRADERFDSPDSTRRTFRWSVSPIAVWEGFLFINLDPDPRAVRGGVRVAARPLRALQSSRTHRRAHHPVRRQVELEARLPELLRVPSLLAGSSAAHDDHAVEQRRERSLRGAVPRRLHGDERAAREPVDERPGVWRAGGRAR